MMDLINAWASLALALLTGWAVMSRRVRDGVIIKAGLICLSVGFLCAGMVYLQTPNQHDRRIDAVHLLMYIGLLICLAGYYLRTRRGLNRRLGDWIDLQPKDGP